MTAVTTLAKKTRFSEPGHFATGALTPILRDSPMNSSHITPETQQKSAASVTARVTATMPADMAANLAVQMPPEPALPDLSRIPQAMREAPRWLVWRAEGTNGKARKVPYYATGQKRQGTLDTPEDQARLASLDTALAALKTGRYTGLGFALGPDDDGNHWQGVDFDHLSEHPDLATLAESLPGYRETSPSGDGVHAIGYGRPFDSLGSNATGIEAYAKGRYFTFTGAALGGDIEDVSEFVTAVLKPRHSPEKQRPQERVERPQAAPALDTDEQVVRDLRSALTAIPADDYATWISMGMALSELGGCGRSLWLEWSQTSAKYRPEDARKFDTFDASSTGYRAVFAEAARHGWANPARRERIASVDVTALIASARAKQEGGAPESDTTDPASPEQVLGELAARGMGLSRAWDRERVLGALAYLDPTQDLGLVARALHHADAGGTDALALLAQWLGAETAEDLAKVEEAWLALDPHPKKPITLRGLFKEARNQGWDGAPYVPPPLPLATVDLSRMREPRVPPRFALDPLIPRKLVTLMGAHGGAGKSMLALAFAAHVCSGRAWAGHSATTGRALYVSLEDDGIMVLDRLHRVIDAYGLDADAVLEGLTVKDGTGGESALAIERPFVRSLAPTRLLQEIADAAHGCALVIIDNASDAFAGDENNRVQVRGFMRMLGDIARQSGAAVLLLAHIDKAAARYGASGNTYSGSTAWHNSARSRLALTERDGVIELAQEKLTVAKKADPILLSWTDNGVLIPGNQGAEAAQGILEAEDDRALLACMAAAAEAGATVPTNENGPATTWHTLSVFAECPDRLKTNKMRFRATVARLVRAGKIVREPYMAAGRNRRERYVLPASVCVSPDLRETDANPRPLCVSLTHRGVGTNSRTGETWTDSRMSEAWTVANTHIEVRDL